MAEELPRHCERSEAIHDHRKHALLRRLRSSQWRRALPLCVSTAPDRRHRHLLAPAGAAIDLLAGTELEILVHADTYFAEPVLVAGHGDRRGAQAGIGLDEGLLDLSRRNGFRSRQFE